MDLNMGMLYKNPKSLENTPLNANNNNNLLKT